MKKVTKGTLTIRAVVAAYLLYLAYGLFQDYDASGNKMVTVAAIIVFALCGGVILITALRSLAKGDYDHGDDTPADHNSMEEKRNDIEQSE